MALQHLERLRLDPEQARSVTDFLESYANTTGRELESSGPRKAADDDAGQTNTLWTLTMDMASALREAASWAAYFDVDRAIRLLRRAGVLYQQAGLAFGSFLLAVANSIQVEELSRDITLLAQLHGQSDVSDAPEIPSALYHPQQQAYMLLACAGMANQLDSYSERLHAIAAESLNRQGVLPFGALGMPVRVAWDIGLHLLEKNTPESLDVVAGHLATWCRRYAETMELAMVNDHLWDHAAAPVDVGDMEIMGIVALSASHFGRGQIAEAIAGHGVNRDEIAFIPIDLGIEISEGPIESHDQ